MPDVDTALAQALRQAKTGRMYFAFVVKGGSDGALVVSKKAIKPDEIKQAKAKCGGSAVIRGRCFGEDGQIVFETPNEPPASLAKQIRTVAARDAGITLRVETRGGGQQESESEEQPTGTAPPPPEAPTPTDDKVRFTDLLRQVRPRFQQALTANPPNKANLEKGMGMAVTAAKENDFAKGLKVLQALDVALQKTPTSTVPPPPPPPMPTSTVPPPSPPPSATAAVQAALAKMIPLVKNAAAANPDRKADLLEPLKRCQDHLKNNQAAEAKAALFDLNRVLKELNGTAPPPPTGTAPVPESEAEGEEEEREETEAKEDTPAPEGKEEPQEQEEEEEEEEEKSGTTPTTDVKEKAQGQQEKEGEEEEEEEKSGTAPTTEGKEEAEEEEETTTVAVWVNARDKVVAQVQQLQAALGKESQETGDPDFDLIADKGLAAITKRMQVGLHVALLEYDRSSGDARAAARAKAQKVVGEFQTFLGSNGLVELAEDNPWGVKVEIRSTLGAALDRLAKTLSA